MFKNIKYFIPVLLFTLFINWGNPFFSVDEQLIDTVFKHSFSAFGMQTINLFYTIVFLLMYYNYKPSSSLVIRYESRKEFFSNYVLKNIIKLSQVFASYVLIASLISVILYTNFNKLNFLDTIAYLIVFYIFMIFYFMILALIFEIISFKINKLISIIITYSLNYLLFFITTGKIISQILYIKQIDVTIFYTLSFTQIIIGSLVNISVLFLNFVILSYIYKQFICNKVDYIYE